MRLSKVPAYFGPLFLSIFLLAPLQAQTAPAAGTTVAVKMIDTVNSGSDPAGKQYRASVAKAVDAGNGVTIAQGAAATVTLKSSGSDFTAQLSSITINGQVVAVTSDSATVSAATQYAQAKAASAVSSVLGGFGHHVSVPASVTAVATGQHISLPTGTTLTFVLGASPASNTAVPAEAAVPAMEASAAPTPASSAAASPASKPAPGPAAAANGRYVYCFTGHYENAPTNYFTSATEPVTYFSEVFPEPSKGLHVSVDWNNFLQKKSMPQGRCINGVQAGKQQIEDEYRKEKKKVVETGWKYTTDAAANAATAPASAAAASEYYVHCAAIFGERARENCATAANEYYVYCDSANLPGPVVYFSDVFAFNKNVSSDGRDISAMLAGPFLEFLETKFGVKVNSDFYSTSQFTGGSYPTNCSQSFPPLSFAQTDKQRIEDNVTKNLHRQVVETGWKTSIVPLPPVTAPLAAANEYYVFCYSDPALTVQYFSGIFAAVPTGDPIRNAFFASLQKKYGFNDPRPGPPVECDVSPKPGDAFMFKTEWSVRQNREGRANISKYKVVETGWKYTP